MMAPGVFACASASVASVNGTPASSMSPALAPPRRSRQLPRKSSAPTTVDPAPYGYASVVIRRPRSCAPRNSSAMRAMSLVLLLFKWWMCIRAPVAPASDTISAIASNDDCGSITLW
jgi:hypothetical protein